MKNIFHLKKFELVECYLGWCAVAEIIVINPQPDNMESTIIETKMPTYLPYQKVCCDLCGLDNWFGYMTQRDDGIYCEQCAALPPYSDKLYNAIVALQRLFRAHYQKAAKPCANCGHNFLYLHDFRTDMGPICYYCIEDELEEIREQYQQDEEDNNSCGYDEPGPCEDCGNPYECVCLELKEDAYLKRHRRVCGDKTCDGGCGTLDCGCIDVCRNRCGTRDY